MERFWRLALPVCGMGAVGAFVFWSLYKDWLDLPIFNQLTPEQTFLLMLTFLGLTFLAALAMLVVYVISPSSSSSQETRAQAKRATRRGRPRNNVHE